LIGIWIYCLTPFVVAGLVFVEHRFLRRVNRDPDIEPATRRLLFLAIYLAPLLLYMIVALTIAGIYLDGVTAWLGEIQPIDRWDEFMVNMFWIVAVSWPFLGMYTLLGGLAALVVWREKSATQARVLDKGSY
jgi:hypothetical protein